MAGTRVASHRALKSISQISPLTPPFLLTRHAPLRFPIPHAPFTCSAYGTQSEKRYFAYSFHGCSRTANLWHYVCSGITGR